MSEPESQLPEQPPRPSRLRRFFLRHVPLAMAGAVVLLALAAVGLFFWMSSMEFEGLVRKRLVAELEQSTGGRVEIASFTGVCSNSKPKRTAWSFTAKKLRARRPTPGRSHAAWAISIFGFWSPSVRLRDLDVYHPALHLIVYADGSTNQPHPRRPRTSFTHDLDTFFNLQAGHISVEQGVLDYDSRAAAFDFQNRWASPRLPGQRCLPAHELRSAAAGNPESYRIEAGAADLNLLAGGISQSTAKPVHGHFQATLDLTRTAAYLRSLRITTRGRDGSSHALEVSGALDDFAHPRWQARALGDLDMKLLDPVFGYPFAPEGIAHLDLTARERKENSAPTAAFTSRAAPTLEPAWSPPASAWMQKFTPIQSSCSSRRSLRVSAREGKSRARLRLPPGCPPSPERRSCRRKRTAWSASRGHRKAAPASQPLHPSAVHNSGQRQGDGPVQRCFAGHASRYGGPAALSAPGPRTPARTVRLPPPGPMATRKPLP